MMPSYSMIKTLIANLHLSIRDADHFHYVMNGLSGTLKDEQHLEHFDCFAFAWGLLPMWAKISLLTAAYREDKAAFVGITPSTPIEQLNPQQRDLLSHACHQLLAATVTLFSNWQFTEDFHSTWAPARQSYLQPTMENAA